MGISPRAQSTSRIYTYDCSEWETISGVFQARSTRTKTEASGKSEVKTELRVAAPFKIPWMRRALTIPLLRLVAISTMISEMRILLQCSSRSHLVNTTNANCVSIRAHAFARMRERAIGIRKEKRRSLFFTWAPGDSGTISSLSSEEGRVHVHVIYKSYIRVRIVAEQEGEKERDIRKETALFASTVFDGQIRLEHLFSWLQLSHLAAIVCRSAQNSAPTEQPPDSTRDACTRLRAHVQRDAMRLPPGRELRCVVPTRHQHSNSRR